MATIEIQALKIDSKCSAGDFIISEDRVYMIAPFTDREKLCLFSLDNGYTLDRSINLKDLTPREAAELHDLKNYTYVKRDNAEIIFRAKA